MLELRQTTRFRFWIWLIRLIGVIVPRRLRADWRQEWEAELRYREARLAEWDRLDSRNKFDLLWRSTSAFWDALWMQTYRWEDEMMQDIRFGVRMLLNSKAFTAAAVLSLSLGIGANTAIFSLLDAVLLKMLPVEHPDQLYFINNVGARGGSDAPPYPCFARFRDQNQSFTGLAAFTKRDLRIRIDGHREEITGQFVSGDYFSLLGVNPILGRALSPDDDMIPEKGGPDGYVAVISYNYWARRFGRSPEVIGKVAQIGNDPVTIVGVTPPEFYGLIPGAEIDISLPMMFEGAQVLASNHTWWFHAVGRLKPNASVEHAQTELDAIFQSFMTETSVSAEMRRDAYARIELAPASRGLDTLRRQFSRPLQTLMCIVALVLLIACANVANLLLARATARRKEFGIRLALGASRRRLLRQMLTESLLLISLSALLGLLMARWCGAFLTKFFATGSDRLSVNLTLDYRVLLFTAGVALLTGLIFGLGPALQATRVDPTPALKDSASPRSRSRFGKSLVIAQVALSLFLLVGAGLFLRTLRNLKTIDAGFRPEGVVTMRVNPAVAINQGARLANLWQEILTRVERLPGARAASLSTLSPLGGLDSIRVVEVAGFTPNARQDQEIRLNQVSPGFFSTFGIGLLQGHTFTEADSETAPKVALLNETAARFYFGDRNPIGGQLSFKRNPRAAPALYQVVGVVRDSRYNTLREPDRRTVYLPMEQSLDQLGRLTLAVRGDGRPAALTDAVRNALRAAGDDILVTYIATLDEQVDQSLLQERLLATLALFFGMLALLLACVGLYGVMSYDVAQRTHEIGIRMALGANAPQVVRLVLRQTLVWVALGVALGLGAALLGTRWAESLLFGLKPNDPLTIGLATLTLLAVAVVAGYLPARRAARVDPLAALRHE
jgi:putative ABC transport system permease protein